MLDQITNNTWKNIYDMLKNTNILMNTITLLDDNKNTILQV